jgi:hypothetical protein
VVAGQILVGWLAVRLVLNAIALRERYRTAIGRLAGTWKDVQALKPAGDPTVAFIGENWWKLPATLGAMLLTF